MSSEESESILHFGRELHKKIKNVLEILCMGPGRMRRDIILGDLSQLECYTLYKGTVCYTLVLLSSRKLNLGYV